MAILEKQNNNNHPGPLFVDTSCIDCGTCFHIAPDLFHEKNNLSFVNRQPENLSEWTEAKEAILSCPTNSIGVHRPPQDFKNAPLTLPRHITDTIYFCGYASEDSYGATAYLIQTPAGNILIDSPRFNSHLVKEIEKIGGVKWMFLSHQDDVADHEKFHQHFKCTRIIHRNDLQEDTKNCEMILEGEEDFHLNADIKIISTPGHTRGHLVLHYKNQFLFTGDHLFYDAETTKIYASKSVNWFSWEKQVQSIKKLIDLNVDWIFPGHGGWSQIGVKAYKNNLEDLVSL
jgi:glyoxylase-like metal-dependent hydrolase (beta-lactamase superfamily II)/ferredoxin